MAEAGDRKKPDVGPWLTWLILPGVFMVLLTGAILVEPDGFVSKVLGAVGSASAVGAVWGLWQYAKDVRDRERGMEESTEALAGLTTRMDDRFSTLADEMQTRLEDLKSALNDAQDLTADVRSLSRTVEELRGTLESSAQRHEDETVLWALPGTLEDVWSKTRIDVPHLFGVLERVAVRNESTDVYERRVDAGGPDSA